MITETKTMTENPLKRTLAYGQSIWYDGLVTKEEFARLIQEDGVRGATTNPAIFEKALSGTEYNAEIAKLKNQSEEEIYRLLSVRAVQEVADEFLNVYRQTRGHDGFVSIEVSPLLAYDTQKTIEEARELWRLVGRKNVMIKVPATREGIPAIETLISEGINVNITLIFSIERHEEVMSAYIRGLEKRLAAEQPLTGIASVASFFVSRVDSAVDKLLADKKNAAANALLGKVGIANSKAAYDAFRKNFYGKRFEKLKAAGAQVQRPLWASTGTKNPAYKDVLYVEELMGVDTVNTVPPPTLDAFRDHGVPGARLDKEMQSAYGVLESLKSFGISLSQVTEELEKAGVKAFNEAYLKIMEGIKVKKQ